MSNKQNDNFNESRMEAFEEFMAQEHMKARPMVLDDDLPDDYDDWISNMTDMEYNEYVDKFSDLINKK